MGHVRHVRLRWGSADMGPRHWHSPGTGISQHWDPYLALGFLHTGISWHLDLPALGFSRHWDFPGTGVPPHWDPLALGSPGTEDPYRWGSTPGREGDVVACHGGLSRQKGGGGGRAGPVTPPAHTQDARRAFPALIRDTTSGSSPPRRLRGGGTGACGRRHGARRRCVTAAPRERERAAGQDGGRAHLRAEPG